jgi:hypothetical protein
MFEMVVALLGVTAPGPAAGGVGVALDAVVILPPQPANKAKIKRVEHTCTSFFSFFISRGTLSEAAVLRWLVD